METLFRAVLAGALVVVALCGGLPGQAAAQGGPLVIGEATEAERYFAQLQAAGDRRTALGIEAKIRNLWLDAGGPTLSLLTSRAMDAILRKEFDHAIDLLDTVIALDPDYAEAWNQRATVHILGEEYGKALRDLERTLALEPRHFGALADLGLVFGSLGDKKRALAAFTRALEINPHMDKVREAAEKLRSEIERRL